MNTTVRRQLTEALATLRAARQAARDLTIDQQQRLIAATQLLGDLELDLIHEAIETGELT